MSETVTIAEKLAADFRAGAADSDRTGAFPFANYEKMRAAGYLRAPVPSELGGLGATLADTALGQQALARGCASTALAVNMHLFQVGSSADAWRNGAPVEAILRRIADEGIVIASNGAEAIVAGDWTTATTAEKRDGIYILNGRKFFCSQSPGMDVLRLLARDTQTGELLIVGVGATTPGLSVEQTWDTTGMRATASHDIVLRDVQVPETAVGARLPAGAPLRHPPIANVGRWFLPLVSSVYLGIAQEAREEAYRLLGTGINSSNRDLALTDVMLGELEADFLTATAVRNQILQEIGDFPTDLQSALARAILCKEVVVRHCAAVVDKAVAIAGGRAYFRKSPLERLARDVRAGQFHPPAAPVSFQIAGERAREARAATVTA
jgi:alkylation response protein AidB-like acyl-CoA dehydrogenase